MSDRFEEVRIAAMIRLATLSQADRPHHRRKTLLSPKPLSPVDRSSTDAAGASIVEVRTQRATRIESSFASRTEPRCVTA
jgi:hypothetical protein